MKPILKAYRYFLILIAFDLVVLALYPATGATIFHKTGTNFLEMLSVLPPIFILLGLLEVWVPRETIIRFLGEKSGLLGVFLSMLLGAVSAGPLYAAFPVAAVMLKKGAKFANIMVFLYSWSTMKLPILLFETSAMGAQFAVTRLLINIPGIILLAWLTSRLLPCSEQEEIYRKYLAPSAA